MMTKISGKHVKIVTEPAGYISIIKRGVKKKNIKIVTDVKGLEKRWNLSQFMPIAHYVKEQEKEVLK
ncbi:hypothetical protein QUF80_20175 [Desulfococcaceae bacterium HSG8]|nr:hypothetical protein [Desulfococcaceae bacterium HSG8]